MESLEQKLEKIRQSFHHRFEQPIQQAEMAISDIWVRDVFDDHIIVSFNGKTYSVNFTESGGEYIFDSADKWTEVTQEWIAKSFKVLDGLTNGNDLVIEGYLALYGGDDLTGERFTKSTQFDSDYTRLNMVAIDWEHGMKPDGKTSPGENDILGRVDWESVKTDDTGLLVRRILDRRNKYVSKIIEPLARAGLLASSSEAVPELIKKSTDGTIEIWPVKRDSFTVMPAEPRLMTDYQMQVVKSLADELPALKSLISNGAQESAADKANIQGQTNGDIEMPTKEELQAMIADAVKAALGDNKPPDFAAIAKQVGEDAVKAYLAKLEETPAAKKGLTVVEDETDKAIKAMKPETKLGLKLQAVKSIALNQPNELTPHHKAILGQNESVPQDGGFLVGTEQEMMLEKKMHDSAVFAGRAQERTISAGANSVDFYGRKENSRANGSRYGGIRGYRVAEGGTITASSMDFYKFTVKPEKYAVLAYATNEVMRDATLLGQEIGEAAPEELAFMIDDDMLNGAAAGYPTGILNSNCLVTVAKESGQAATTINAQNIINMWARLWARSEASAVWFVNKDTFPQLAQLNIAVGTGGQLIYMPPGGLSGSPYASLYGRPVVSTEFNATLGTVGDIVLADFSQYKLANMGAVQTASSMHVQFLTDQMVWRFTVEYDGQATWEAALTPYKGTNTQSPFIALATRS